MSGTYKTLREWPYGLLDELYGKEGAEYELPDDFEGTIQYVLCMLPQKDREVLKARYEGRLSLEDMAGMFGVTRERIRQVIVSRALDAETTQANGIHPTRRQRHGSWC